MIKSETLLAELEFVATSFLGSHNLGGTFFHPFYVNTAKQARKLLRLHDLVNAQKSVEACHKEIFLLAIALISSADISALPGEFYKRLISYKMFCQLEKENMKGCRVPYGDAAVADVPRRTMRDIAKKFAGCLKDDYSMSDEDVENIRKTVHAALVDSRIVEANLNLAVFESKSLDKFSRRMNAAPVGVPDGSVDMTELQTFSSDSRSPSPILFDSRPPTPSCGYVADDERLGFRSSSPAIKA